MTSASRLARLEASLSTRRATLLWLAEAQRFGSLSAYAASLVDEPAGMLPLVAVPQQARRAVRGALRGQPRNVIAEREQETFHEALFLIQLVLELERAAQATRQRAELRWLALWSELGSSRSEEGLSADPSRAWRAAMCDLLVTIASSTDARVLLERRFLAGRDALFPQTRAAWQELREAAGLLAERGGSRPSGASIKTRATSQATAIVETARAASLALVGESGSAVGAKRSP